MELSTFLWICGLAAAYYTGSTVSKARSKAEISALQSQLNAAKGQETGGTKTVAPKLTHAEKPDKNESKQSAKEAFVENVKKFVPNLNTLLDGTYNSSQWTEIIVDINNDELTSLWKKANKKVDYILRIFGMWGLKPEYCTSFVATENNKEMYETINGESIIKGNKYVVKSPCWILTDDTQSKKTIVLKGIVTNEDN